MKILTQEEIKHKIDTPLFNKLTETADELQLECYLVGGYVRDLFLERPTNDIDVVVVGSGIKMPKPLPKSLGAAPICQCSATLAQHKSSGTTTRLSSWAHAKRATHTTHANP